MTEITIRTSNNIAMSRLIDFLQLFDFQIVSKKETDLPMTLTEEEIPITYASEKADVLALANIWKNRVVTTEQLRAESWGGRL